MEIKATIEMFRDYQSRPLNHWIALSEYIDNSISSYKKNNNDSVIGLIIDITFDYIDDNNNKLIIVDNSGGMNGVELECSIQPHDINGKSDTGYNQHGVGMKAATFWYGEDLTIYSKRKDDKEFKLELITSNKQSNDFVNVEAFLSKENKIYNESGTMIIVNHVYDKRSILTKPSYVNEINNAIGWRYNKIIKNGAIINFNIMSNDYKKNESLQIQSFFNTPLTKSELLKSNKKRIEKIKENKFYTLSSNYYKKIKAKNIDYVNELWDKLNNDEPLMSSIKININNQERELKFGILDENSKHKRYCGLTIYHLDRAIIHGPNDDNSNKGCYYFAENRNNSTIKASWLFGEINLTGIEKPTQNKEEFDWSINGKDDLKNKLNEIFINLNDTILEFIVEISNAKEDNNNKEKVIEILPNKFTNLIESNIEVTENNIEIINIKLENNENLEYNIDIFENGENFLDYKYDELNNKFTLTINPESTFWQPFVGNKEFKAKIMYPTIVVLGLAAWKIEKIINEDNDCKNIDLIEIIKKIINKEIL